MSCERLAGASERAGRCIVILLCCSVAACGAATALPACRPDATAGAGGVMWVMRQGWHTEVGLPAAAITGPLGFFRSVFPGARVLMFGFGKRTFFTAKVETAAELLMGPFPGPSAVQVTGLGVDPPDAYDGPVAALALPPGGAARLSAFLWDIIDKTQTGEPRLIAPGLFPGSLFYAGAREYDLGFTCNTFTAAAIEAAGLHASPHGVVWAGGAMAEAAATGQACRADSALPGS